MTFLRKLKAHVGGLVLIKTDLYWYKTHKWDEAYKRVHLLLDAYETTPTNLDATTSWGVEYNARQTYAPASLFIDGTPKLVWLDSETVELIK